MLAAVGKHCGRQLVFLAYTIYIENNCQSSEDVGFMLLYRVPVKSVTNHIGDKSVP